MPKPRNDKLIKLSDIPALLLNEVGVTRCKTTVYYWARTGKANKFGKNVKLKTSNRLGSLFTTREWLYDFIREIQ